MSWSFKIEKLAEHEEFRRAILAAHGEDIILLGSLGDIAPKDDHPNHYPVGLDELIRIGSATATGDRAAYNRKNGPEFILPGDSVPQHQPDRSGINYVSGSSVATALAAGLAALILYSVDLAYDDQDRRKLARSKLGITRAFQNMC